jgi:hypothetical protein
MSCPIISSTALTLDDDDALFVDGDITDDEDAAADVKNLEVIRLMLLPTMALVLCRGSK